MKIRVTGAFSYSGNNVAQKLLGRRRGSHHIDGTPQVAPIHSIGKVKAFPLGLQ